MKAETKWYEKTYIIIICFISVIFIPLGIFLIWKRKKLNLFWKSLISFVSGIFFLIFSVGFYLALTEDFIPPESTKVFVDNVAEKDQETENYETSNTPLKPPIEVKSEDASGNEEVSKNEVISEKSVTENKSEKKVKDNGSTSTKSSGSKSEPISDKSKTSSKDSGNESKSSAVANDKSVDKTAEATKNTNNSKRTTVYITKSGKKYHYANPCGKGTYTAINIDDAIKQGYQPCKKCVK